jgi:hypothetical protein
MFIGSLMDEHSPRQQYVWLHGDGGRGKGTLLRFLRRVLGPSFSAETPGGDKFWTYGLVGKVLVGFAECDDAKFTTKAIFKSITGGDPVRVEGKGIPAFTATLCCKVIFASNSKPEISGSEADRRRIIYCDVGPRPEGQGMSDDYEELLWAEASHFLHDCRRLYMKNGRNPIPVGDPEMLLALISENEERFETIFNTYFEAVPKGEIEPYALFKVLNGMERLTNAEISRFKTWAAREHGVTKTRYTKGSKEWYYQNMRLQAGMKIDSPLRVITTPPHRETGL